VQLLGRAAAGRRVAIDRTLVCFQEVFAYTTVTIDTALQMGANDLSVAVAAISSNQSAIPNL
jgi:hypothetical protein